MRKIDIEQGTYEWHLLRQGCVTGTTLSSAIGSPKVQETLLYKLVAERMTEPQIDDINSKAVERGSQLEPLARKAVIAETGINFTETGVLESEEVPWFRISPDAIYETGGKIVGGLEIKCPDSKKHIEYVIKGGIPKEYRDQVRAPFLMSEDIEWWYFASFDDRNYQKPLFLHKAYRHDFDLSHEREKLKAFLARVHEAHLEQAF